MPQILPFRFTLSRITAIFLFASLFFSAASHAQEVEEMQTIEIVEEQIAEVESGSSITVYVKAKFTRRTKGAAKDLTESHNEHEARGYRFTALSPYNENGDLQGFFVTYTKI